MVWCDWGGEAVKKGGDSVMEGIASEVVLPKPVIPNPRELDMEAGERGTVFSGSMGGLSEGSKCSLLCRVLAVFGLPRRAWSLEAPRRGEAGEEDEVGKTKLTSSGASREIRKENVGLSSPWKEAMILPIVWLISGMLIGDAATLYLVEGT